MSRIDRIAILLSLIMVFTSHWLSAHVFENIPHIEDEMAYVWQANVIARGELTLQSPPCPKCFLVPFVIDYQGIRFGKYPPGWPAILALGIKLGMRDWINPFFAGFCVWLIYLLLKNISNEKSAFIAIILTMTSPFYLLNSAVLLSHIWSLWLTLSFILAWLDLFRFSRNRKIPTWMLIIIASFSLGLLILTRPLTAIGIALPFILHGLIILFKGNRRQKFQAIWLATFTLLIALLLPLWQYAVTGDPFLNPYQLWWPYDQIGFGSQIGLQPGGYSPIYARMNAKFSLGVGLTDLFGWFKFSYLFIPIGFLALWKKWQAWLITAIFPCLVLAYAFYWIGSWLYGPRYYFEGIIGLIMLSAVGIQTAAGKFRPGLNPLKNWRWMLITTCVSLLISANIFFYLPQRLGNMVALHGASKSQLLPFESASAMKLTPSIVIVHTQNYWIEYGTLLEISSPFLDSPWIMTYSRGSELDQFVAQQFPSRSVWHYYPDQPTILYSAERPSQ